MPEFSYLALQCIKMIYIEKPSDLLLYLCEFHTKESFPASIMIDDIQYYVSHLSQEQSKEAAMVKLFAMLEDTVAFISEKKGEACHRMVSLLKGFCPKNFIKRYFRELWYASCSEKENEYFLTDDNVPAFRAVVQLTPEDEKIMLLGKIQRLNSENESEVQ
ncbi:uncharacterized protein NPIL_663411 [Nephila pilipes]|uniref:Uncharacterized protein n=1 Tax=Nephila pilipes TaxID=299642 RepID=A0A8X6QCN1_NEPPI|nr:uncharacterized protein NPIL_663411 [Nephila pilipes]